MALVGNWPCCWPCGPSIDLGSAELTSPPAWRGCCSGDTAGAGPVLGLDNLSVCGDHRPASGLAGGSGLKHAFNSAFCKSSLVPRRPPARESLGLLRRRQYFCHWRINLGPLHPDIEHPSLDPLGQPARWQEAGPQPSRSSSLEGTEAGKPGTGIVAFAAHSLEITDSAVAPESPTELKEIAIRPITPRKDGRT